MQLVHKRNKERQKNLQEQTSELNTANTNKWVAAQAQVATHNKDFADKLKQEQKRNKDKEAAKERMQNQQRIEMLKHREENKLR